MAQMDLNLFVLPIVQDFGVLKDNLKTATQYWKREIKLADWLEFSTDSPKPPYILMENISKLVENISDSQIEHTLQQIRERGVEFYTAEPAREIVKRLEDVDYELNANPEYFGIIVLRLRDVIIAYVSLVIDPKTKLFGQKLGDFIGIRKTLAFHVLQQLHPEFNSVKVSDYLIPGIINLAREHGAKYVTVNPLHKMRNILIQHFGFKVPLTEDVMTSEPNAMLFALPSSMFVYREVI